MTSANTSNEKKRLPVFFFHGLTASSKDGCNIKAKVLAEGRAFVALTFAEGEDSLGGIKDQIPMAIAEIRRVVASDVRFADGYVFMGHSMGGLIARAVVEEMDDHKVKTLVTLAAPHLGLFYGPQEADVTPAKHLPAGIGELMLSPSVFDFKAYSEKEYRGKMQQDFARLSLDTDVQASNAFVNLAWIPPIYLNAVPSSKDNQRRKNNFLKLKEVHAFASPNDGVAAPWQTGVFGHYSEVSSLEEIEASFEGLAMVDMKQTVEYKEDSYGLRTLDERGAVFRHVVPDVPHTGWLSETALMDKEGIYRIVFYRDGPFQMVLNHEVTAVREACQALQVDLPSISFVIVQTRYNTRLFPASPMDVDHSGNEKAGAVVHSGICHPIENDFYLMRRADGVAAILQEEAHTEWHQFVGCTSHFVQQLVVVSGFSDTAPETDTGMYDVHQAMKVRSGRSPSEDAGMGI
uniref:Piwi domain-containing protein n=1 Tax=Phytophthora ramorum TaxID=164328 RepID=H3GF99_PHYRM